MLYGWVDTLRKAAFPGCVQRINYVGFQSQWIWCLADPFLLASSCGCWLSLIGPEHQVGWWLILSTSYLRFTVPGCLSECEYNPKACSPCFWATQLLYRTLAQSWSDHHLDHTTITELCLLTIFGSRFWPPLVQNGQIFGILRRCQEHRRK